MVKVEKKAFLRYNKIGENPAHRRFFVKKLIALSLCLLLLIPTAAFASEGSFVDGSVLKKGFKGPEVRLLQQALKMAGFYQGVETTENFGEATEKAVKAYQTSAKITADGVAGNGTIAKLSQSGFAPILKGSIYKPDNSYDDLPALQAALHSEGLYTGNFGKLFDAKTLAAVKLFQGKYGMTADGVVGKGTLRKLMDLGYINDPMEQEKQAEGESASLGSLTQTAYKQGDNHPDVAVIQQVLSKEGLFDSKDGYTAYYGPQTSAAVQAFQTKYGLTADGVAGKGTLEKMQALKYVSLDVASVSRGTGKRAGIPINWYDIKPKFSAGKTVLTVEDFRTGVTFKVQVSYCATVHADIETLTPQDTETVRKLWGGFSWDRRPVLIHFNGEVYAASMNGLPHAGLDAEPEGVTVSGRSGGFGKGYNFDDVKGNGIDGHFCLHFVGSRTHGGNKIDDKHQANIRIAAGL